MNTIQYRFNAVVCDSTKSPVDYVLKTFEGKSTIQSRLPNGNLLFEASTRDGVKLNVSVDRNMLVANGEILELFI